MIDFNTVDFSNVSELFVAGKEVKELHIDGKLAWSKESPSYIDKVLTIVARQANTTVGIVGDYDPEWGSPGSPPAISLQYSTDNGSTWNSFTVDSTTITLQNVGDSVQFKATTTNSQMATTYNLRFNRFNIVGLADVQGNAQSLLNGTDFTSITTLTNAQLGQIFRGQPVVDASKMVISAPRLDSHSISHMFKNCTSLTKGPEVFGDVIGSQYVIDGFFYNCTSLQQIKIHYTGNFSGNLFDQWVYNVPSTGTFYYNGSDITRGTSAIPTGWNVVQF